MSRPDFLRIEPFLANEIEAQALAFALSRGLIDRLADGPVPEAALAAALDLPPERLDLLAGLLASGGVAEEGPGGLALTAAFRAALPFRDLLEAKLGFAATVAEDLRSLFPAFIADFPAFMARSRTFALFRYDRCFEITPQNLAATRPWVAYTTCLTRYEAGPGLDRIDPSRHRRMLDLGGNSGAFAAAACARAPHLAATVVDLPVVCALGREHLAGRPEAARIAFRPGDMRRDALPADHDLVTFKSVLHDWPDGEARSLLARATAALPPAGTLVIYERARLRLRGRSPDYAMTGNLVFQPFFREAAFYRDALEALGLTVIEAGTVELETPFHLIRACRAPVR